MPWSLRLVPGVWQLKRDALPSRVRRKTSALCALNRFLGGMNAPISKPGVRPDQTAARFYRRWLSNGPGR